MTEGPDRVHGLRVVHVAATASGAHWMFEILCRLRELGYDVVAVISKGAGDLAPKLESAGISYYSCDLTVGSPWDLLGLSRKVFALARLLRTIKPDIVHYHLFTSIILGRAAAWLAGVPFRFSMVTGPFYLEAPAPRKIDLQTIWMDTVVIASCEYTRALYAQLRVRRPVELIYYGADSGHFDPALADAGKIRREFAIPSSCPVVGLVAHFYAPLPPGPWTPPQLWGRGVKGHETFLKAAQLVIDEIRSVKFLLVGTGWEEAGRIYEAELKQLTQLMGLEGYVIFTGFRRDIPDVLAGLDVAVQCSLSENLGGTVEALLMARPTVATAVGGMVDTIRHRETGLLVPPDAPEELAQAILELLSDEDKARRLALRGREWALERFTLAKTVSDIDKLYQNVVGEVLGERGTRVEMYRNRCYRVCRCFGRGTVLLCRESIPIITLLLKLGYAKFYAMLSSALGRVMSLRRGAAFTMKRVMDIVLTIGVLCAFGVPMVLIAFLIRVSMGRPVLYRQVRAGLHGEPFTLVKFRTMREAVDDLGRQLPDEARVTRLGRFLRRWSLDELPELFNVLKGDMSLVGPRPLLVEYVPLYTPEQARRHEVKPGMAGPVIMSGRNILDWEEKFKLDVWYVDNRNFRLDAKILFFTFLKVLKGEGVSSPGYETMPKFTGTGTWGSTS